MASTNGVPPVGIQNALAGGTFTTGLKPPTAIATTGLQLSREYVAGGNLGWFSPLGYGRALPHSVDDIEGDLGDDLYVKMAWDPQIAACLSVFKAGILEGGLDLSPAIDDATDPEYDLAVGIAEEAETMFDNLQTALDDVLWDMLSCLHLGSKVAELVFEMQPGVTENRPMLHIVAIKPKPRNATAFVVDAYTNVYGLLIRAPMQASPLLGTATFDPQHPPENFLPRAKFCISSFRPIDSDPRGTSILRPAYDPWWRKRQIYLEHLRYMSQFAGPSIIGFTAPDAQTQAATDDLGNIIAGQALVTPEMAMQSALEQFRNGTAAAFPAGAAVHVLQASGDGSPFFTAIAECNISITKALLTQSLATEEGEHSTRAAAGVHQDVLGTLVRQGKRSLLRMVTKDILTPWVLRNWGEKVVHLTPIASLGESEQQDVAPMLTALAAAGYTIGPSQLAGIDVSLGLPVRDTEADQEMADAAADRAMPQPSDPAGAAGAPAGAAPGAVPPAVPAAAAPIAQTGGAPQAPSPMPPVPPGRVAVRPHTRGVRQKPVAVMSASSGVPFKPKGKPLSSVPASVKYTAADLRALAAAWDQSMPEQAGLLAATLTDASRRA